MGGTRTLRLPVCHPFEPVFVGRGFSHDIRGPRTQGLQPLKFETASGAKAPILSVHFVRAEALTHNPVLCFIPEKQD